MLLSKANAFPTKKELKLKLTKTTLLNNLIKSTPFLFFLKVLEDIYIISLFQRKSKQYNLILNRKCDIIDIYKKIRKETTKQ